jgi:hypothetical protein
MLDLKGHPVLIPLVSPSLLPTDRVAAKLPQGSRMILPAKLFGKQRETITSLGIF